MDELYVETPIGCLVVKQSCDKEYPGVWVELRRPGVDCDLALALVEYTKTEADCDSGELITCVWGDGQNEDYTHRTIHRGVDEYFNACESEV